MRLLVMIMAILALLLAVQAGAEEQYYSLVVSVDNHGRGPLMESWVEDLIDELRYELSLSDHVLGVFFPPVDPVELSVAQSFFPVLAWFVNVVDVRGQLVVFANLVRFFPASDLMYYPLTHWAGGDPTTEMGRIARALARHVLDGGAEDLLGLEAFPDMEEP